MANFKLVSLNRCIQGRESEKQWINEWIPRRNFIVPKVEINDKLDKKGGVMVPRKMVIDNIECLPNKLVLVYIWRIKNTKT
ncbi:hypothetical protein pdam_00021374 [Pocillopora damicornis]|uniref:Uncharacterized protein n=1 Tax=Pocillopora damicornis TaxID=46731 RepID=A0A3M6TET1_POCDA|nr:hypothetical protein pdam_00021374 [Pocillopora damicornis]